MTDLLRRTLKESSPAYWEYEQKWLRGEVDNGIKVHFKLYSSKTDTYEIDHPLVPANTREFEDMDCYHDLNELRSGKDSSVRKNNQYIAVNKFEEITAKDRERISRAIVAYHKLRQSKKSKAPIKSKVIKRKPEKQLDLFKVELMSFTIETPEEGSEVIVWTKDALGKTVVVVCLYQNGRYLGGKPGRSYTIDRQHADIIKWCYLPGAE